MSWLGRFFLWRARRRHRRHQRFLRDAKIVFTFDSSSRPDSRAWSDAFMRSLRK